MTQRTSRTLIVTTTFILLILSYTGCATYASLTPGDVQEVIEIPNASILMGSVSDALMAVTVRNNTMQAQKVSIVPIGTEIGYRYSQSSHFFSISTGSGSVRAAFLSRPQQFILAPGEQQTASIFLSNWYLANKNFSARIVVYVGEAEERHRADITTDQSDWLEDPRWYFQQQKLGRFTVGHETARLGIESRLPYGYRLNIPD